MSFLKLAGALACIAIAISLGAIAAQLTEKTATPTPAVPTEEAGAAVPTPRVAQDIPPGVTPNLFSVNTPVPGDGSLPRGFSCPEGWTPQNAAARRYAFCIPPGWVARIASAGVPRVSEVEGSMARLVSPEQLFVSGTPRTGTVLSPASNSAVVDVYVTSYQVSADLPRQPVCTAPSTMIAGIVVAQCELDNTASSNAPYRYRAYYGRLNVDTFVHVLVTLGKDASNQLAQTARQVAATLVFY
jgi:hypothetical protein